MLSSARTLWALIAPLFLVGSARAIMPEVEDGAGFFSPAAIQKANELIRDIKVQFNQDFEIQTYKTIPGERDPLGQAATAEGRERIFTQWVNDQMRALKLAGIYVLICKDPGHVRIGVSEETRKKAFPATARARLRDAFVKKFKEKDFDGGLQDAINVVREELQKNAPATMPPVALNEVRDYAGFFKSETVRKADQELRALHDKAKEIVIFETFKKFPSEKLAAADMGPSAVSERYATWMRERVRKVRFDVYLVVTREPSHIQIGIGADAEKKAFTKKDRDELRDLLIAKFRQKEFDQGLLDGMAYLRKTISMNLNIGDNGASSPAADKTSPPLLAAGLLLAQGGDWSWVLWVAVALFCIWVVFAIMRGISHSQQRQPYGSYPSQPPQYGPGQGPPGAGQPPPPPGAPGYGQPPVGYGSYPPPGYGGGRGGGFLSGMLGGLFGAAAGNWMYDSFFRGPQAPPSGGGMLGSGSFYGGRGGGNSNQPPAYNPPPANVDDGNYGGGGDYGAPPDNDSGSSGGDFDTGSDAGGGGDFDTGGDSSGGDFGGGGDFDSGSGDSGGGGDF